MRKTKHSTKLGRNEACWCGSGKKYKRCHLVRADETPVPFGQLRATLERPFAKKKMCLHPDAPRGCGKVIRAHTLQRAGILRDLSGKDGHVFSFHPLKRDESGAPTVHKVGWHDASTFQGFCGTHDHSLFLPIEKHQFTGSDEQILLIGYRAICHEIYQKQAAVEASLALRSTVDRGVPPELQREIQEHMLFHRQGLHRGIEDLSYIKSAFDTVLKTGAYEKVRSVTIQLKGQPRIASTAPVHVDFTLRGQQLQDLAVNKTPLHAFSYGVVSIPGGSVFSAVWPSEFTKCEEFIDSLLSYEREAIPSVLTEFFFHYAENTYFSDQWWSSLTTVKRERIRQLAIADSYGTPLVFSGINYTEMEVVEIKRRT